MGKGTRLAGTLSYGEKHHIMGAGPSTDNRTDGRFGVIARGRRLIATAAGPSLLILGFSISAVAQDRLAECSSIADDEERLECYDGLARQGPADVASGESSSGVTNGEWVIKDEVNPMDDTRTVVAVLPAESGTNSTGDPVGLFVRCLSGKAEVFIAWRDYLADDRQHVTIRIDDYEPSSRRWGGVER